MARNEDLLCLLCSVAPCICNKPQGATPRRTARPKPQEAAPAEVPVAPARPSFMDKIREQTRREELDKKADLLKSRLVGAREQSDSRFADKMTDEEAATLAAVRILSEAFEIHPDDLEPFKDRLSRESSVEERAGAWRYRNGMGA